MNINEKLAYLREILFPYNCPVCGQMLLDGKEAYYGLCASCAEQFTIEDVPRCALCGKPLISERNLCISCKRDGNFAFDAAVVFYPYIGKYRQLLAAYKFEKQRNLGRFFAEKFAASKNLLPEAASDAVWVPVPPRPGKIKSTGWDQVETLGRFLERRRDPENIRISRCLKRLASKSQKQLGREARRANLEGKILVTRKPEKHLIVFDDVFTTGTTLSVCAAALKAAGAEKVWGVCLFYD